MIVLVLTFNHLFKLNIETANLTDKGGPTSILNLTVTLNGDFIFISILIPSSCHTVIPNLNFA